MSRPAQGREAQPQDLLAPATLSSSPGSPKTLIMVDDQFVSILALMRAQGGGAGGNRGVQKEGRVPASWTRMLTYPPARILVPGAQAHLWGQVL